PVLSDSLPVAPFEPITRSRPVTLSLRPTGDIFTALQHTCGAALFAPTPFPIIARPKRPDAEMNRMPSEVTMPQLSDTMTEGTVVKWHKKEGDKVRAGEEIADVETDKAVMP